ncbi:MAG: protein kinase, partial [Candidatus Aminicenantes bacterium]|nr:protein kinase [Candidatus Aminicenantes bacterium]
KLERYVALKVLLPDLSEDREITQRFIAEAKIGAQLQHSNIVSIYDVGVYQGNYYFAMEYLERSLEDLMKSFKDSKLKPEIALDILKQMAGALDYAHKQGVIHRDVKPANILLRNDGTPVLVDFGIAKLMESDSKLTKTGTSIGTPHYMSPEQIQGLEIDGRSDIYSLGVVFFEMLEGKTPYEGSDLIVIAVKHIKEAIPRLGEEFSHFQPIIDGMMAKDKKNRIQSGSELNALIQKIQLDVLSPVKEDTIIRSPEKEPEGITIIDEVPENEGIRTKQFKQLIIPVIVIVVILIGIFGILQLYRSNNNSETALWKLAAQKQSIQGYTQYLKEYPEGKYSILAGKKISELEKQNKKIPVKNDLGEQNLKENQFDHWLRKANQAFLDHNLKEAKAYLLQAKALKESRELEDLEKKIKAREMSVRPLIRLRQVPKNITIQDTQAMLKRLGFFNLQKNKTKRFNNSFYARSHNGVTTVADRTTGLMWHQSGSSRYMNLTLAKEWVRNLNQRQYAGYSNWRLPTLEEAASLLETKKNAGQLYLNPIFHGKTRSIWTSDTSGNEYWIVYFDHGYLDVNWPQFNSYVRPVRSSY